ncbi:MAG: rhodanese-like domain-containing protein [Thermomicrobiales bacterium]
MSSSNPSSPLVTVAWLAEHLADPDLLVVDVRPLPMYLAGHIPGAISLDLGSLRLPASDEETIAAWTAVLARALGAAGIGPDRTVVFTEDISGTMASFGVWLLDVAGLHTGRLLDGGLRAWVGAGNPLDRTPVQPTPVELSLTLDRNALMTASDIIAAVAADASPTSVTLVDTRSMGEHGNGTIPGAINLEWMNNLNADGSYKDAATLTAQYAAAGITPANPTVTYCAGGFRAAQTYVALKAAGFPDVRNYAPSWAEWSQLPDAPVVFPDDEDDDNA